MDLKQHIIKEADRLFCTFGIKSVTMDDISRHLGISKKTIYQHFKDKNELVVLLMSDKMENQVCVMDATSQKAKNAIDEVFEAVTHTEVMLSNMNPTLFYDLQKYHREAWQVFKAFRENIFYKKIRQNLLRGIQEGYYRKELDVDIITRMRIEQIDLIFNQTTFPVKEYSISRVLTELTAHFLYGICTLKGHKLINNYKHITDED
ncbi:TetR/AcrR family transcriptional regulator [Rubrolithibacter danxiaensis]|uniref:TetR/AcrR family transcriptional regulator n=1 Tax=Rubrolithibacter danxiaensis TaxID=3390805 RepID=UPI003BF81B1B